MKSSRVIDAEKGIFYTTVTGELTLEEIADDMAKLAAHPDYRPGMSGVIDLRGVTKFLSEEETARLAETIKSNPGPVPRHRRALLVRPDFSYGMYRMFEYFAEGGAIEYSVFRDEAQARAWVEEATGSIRK
jgi:hypothetical protein